MDRAPAPMPKPTPTVQKLWLDCAFFSRTKQKFETELAFWSILPAVALFAVDLYIVVGDVGGVQALVTKLALEAALVEGRACTFDLFGLVTVWKAGNVSLHSTNKLRTRFSDSRVQIRSPNTYTDLLHTGHFATCGGTKGILSVRFCHRTTKKGVFFCFFRPQFSSKKWLKSCQKVDFL